MQEYIVLTFAIFLGLYFAGPFGALLAVFAWWLVTRKTT